MMEEVLQQFDLNIKKGFIKLDTRVTVENNRIESELSDEKIRINQELSEVKQAVNDLEHIVDDTFKDGIIDEQEAIAIEKHINRLKSEKADVDGKYVVIVTNTYLRGADKAGLMQAKTAFNEAHDNLIGSIMEAIADGKTTPQEKANVDSAFEVYNTKLGELSTAFQVAIESIQKVQLEELKIGGRNLVIKGNENKIKVNGVVGGLFGTYKTAKPMAIGGKYTLVWRAKTTSAQGLRVSSGTDLNVDTNKSITFEVKSVVFTADKLTSDLNLYHDPVGDGGKSTISEVDWMMLFEGEVKAPEDFIPSPEDVEESINDGVNASKSYTDAREIVIKNANELYTKDEITLSEAKTLLELENKARETKEYADGISQSLTTDIDTLKDGVQRETDELKASIDNLETAIGQLPIGQELTDVEKQGLKSSLHLVGMEYADVVYKIDVILKDMYLPATNKTTIGQRRTDLVNKYNAVKTSIETALLDSTITQTERDAIDTAMTNFRTSIDQANVALLAGYEAIETVRDADLQAKLNQQKQELEQEIQDVSDAMNGLEENIKGAILDGIVSESEALAIKQHINNLNVQKAEMDAKYNTIYTNPLLVGTPKTDLLTKKTAFNTAHTNLINSINTAIADSNVTPAESSDVDSKFTAYATALGNLTTSIEVAVKSITDGIGTSLRAEIEAQRDALQAEIDDVNTAMGTLGDTIKNAIQDGIISETEALAIAQNINSLNVQKAEMDAKYNTIYANPLLTGASKTDLASKKTAFNTAHTNLINSINTAIADGEVTPTESADVDAKFTAYATALGNLTTSLEVAVKSITDSLGDSLRAEFEAQRVILQAGIDAVNNALDGLEDTIKDAILDGIITESEAMAIKQHINTLKAQKAELDSKYNVIYGNPLLTGSPKTDLASKKTAFNTAHTNLITAIETAITDDNVSPSESADVDAKFTAYATALGNLTTSLENALLSIQNIMQGQVDQALLESANAINTANTARELTNFLTTTVQGNVIATGTLLIGGASTEGNAGITGVTDQDEKSVRIWAGKQFTDRYTAPFQILHDGTLKATSAEIEGNIVAKSLTAEGIIKVADKVGMSGLNDVQYTFTPTANQISLIPYDPLPPVNNTNIQPVTLPRLRFWAGETEANKYLAPFKVFHDGAFVATKGKVGGFSIGNGILEYSPYSYKHEQFILYKVGENIKMGAGEFKLSYTNLADDGSYCGESSGGSPACIIVPPGSPDRIVDWNIETGKQGTVLKIERSGLHPDGLENDSFDGVLTVENKNAVGVNYPAIRAKKGSIVIDNGTLAVGNAYAVPSDIGVWTDKYIETKKGLRNLGSQMNGTKVLTQTTPYTVLETDYHLIVTGGATINLPTVSAKDKGRRLIIDNASTTNIEIYAPGSTQINNMGSKLPMVVNRRYERGEFTYTTEWFMFRTLSRIETT